MFNNYQTEDIVDCTSDTMNVSLNQEQVQQILAMYNISSRRKYEVLALGEVEYDNALRTFTVKDIFIPKQESTGVHCEVTQKAITDIIMAERKINIWIHTHPGMGAFWSAEDEETSRTLCGTTDYSLAIVIGSGHKMLARLDINQPFKMKVALDIEAEYTVGQEALAECRRMITRQVSSGWINARSTGMKGSFWDPIGIRKVRHYPDDLKGDLYTYPEDIPPRKGDTDELTTPIRSH